MDMIGRKEEIKTLEWDLEKDEPQFVAVYGRRRVGKTYLVREMFRDQFTFSHTGLRGASAKAQLAAFRTSLIQYGHDDCPVLRDWCTAFFELFKLIQGAPPGRKVIFIDELPWMDTPKSDLITGLESFWNGRATSRREKDVFLIVCGSASSWIVKKLLHNCEGLYGRLTDRVWLRPFTLAECERYAQRLGLVMTRQEICEAYMAFGGIPYYWSLMRPDLSLVQNMDALFFSERGKLREEFDHLYASLFKNAEQHVKIVEALARKKCGMTREEIIAATGLKNGGNFKTWLEELVQCDFIRKYLPPGKRNRGAIFQLIDNYTLFYYSFLSDGRIHDEHFWSSSLTSPKIAAWKGVAFERVCLQHVRQIKMALGISGIVTQEYAWRSTHHDEETRGAQIDLVLDRADKTVNLCEIKYSDTPYEIDKDEDMLLRNRKALFAKETGGRKNCRTTLIAANGVKRSKYWGTIQSEITLDDLFKE